MNANNPMTPGVYTVEKNAFPPSIAQVPTAIPAFIGYTEKAERNGKSLINQPLLINSLSEYNRYFGGAPEYQFPINLVPKPADGSMIPPGSYDFTVSGKYYKIGPAKVGLFYMYNSLRLFYLNGGGPAYIVSVGTYLQPTYNDNKELVLEAEPADRDKMLAGLELLPLIQFPKPTMIIMPDALSLNEAEDCYVLQQQMISQAGSLRDRVALLDIYEGWLSPDDPASVISNFRNNMGVNNLSYAIAYYPWLECAVVDASELTYANIYKPIDADKADPNLTDISSIIVGEPLLASLDQLTSDLNNLQEHLLITSPLTFTGATSATVYPSWSAAFNGSPAVDPKVIITDQSTVLANMYQLIFDLGNTGILSTKDGAANKLKSNDLKNNIALLSNPKGTLASTMTLLAALESKFPSSAAGSAISDKLTTWGIPVPATPVDPYVFKADVKEADKPKLAFNIAEPLYKNAFAQLLKALNGIISSASSLLMQYNTALETKNNYYQNIMAAIANQVNILPPTGAIAGVYTTVDNTEGVWQAPANRNINSVVAPMVSINDDQQAPLNVDALAGKSINVIRSFYGRGPAIIWGARTMDGNSLDWKYINVRRLLIMVEQSVANAAFSLVFEPNAASTWTLCESMISNFLHNLWSEGALQGASPADAYSVQVGLGKTMTALDILEGIMRVQVKLAVVRPAEFIIITYEQQMATS